MAEGAVTQEEYDLRLSMKRFAFGGATLQRGQNILTGLEEPLQTTDVSDFVIFNWALGDSEVEKLNAYLGIEPGLQLAETTILEKDTKTYQDISSLTQGRTIQDSTWKRSKGRMGHIRSH